MTDSRVTPQAAVEAAGVAIAEYLSTLPYSTNLAALRMQHGEDIAAAALTAAAPLLCQPLQDENERLRAIVEGQERLFRDAQSQAARLAAVVEAVESLHGPVIRREFTDTGIRARTRCTCGALDCRTRAALAAVPVGTGNPTQPRADD